MSEKNKEYPYLDKDGNKICFLHLPEWGRTLAFNLPSADDLNYAVNELVDGAKREAGDDTPAGRIVLNIGISKLHPKDRYSKALGRQVASGRIVRDYAYVRKAIIDSKGILYEVAYQGFTINFFIHKGDKQAGFVNGWGSV